MCNQTNKLYIVLDDTLGTFVSMSSDMISAVSDAREYHERSKNRVQIYLSELVGELKEDELLI